MTTCDDTLNETDELEEVQNCVERKMTVGKDSRTYSKHDDLINESEKLYSTVNGLTNPVQSLWGRMEHNTPPSWLEKSTSSS